MKNTGKIDFYINKIQKISKLGFWELNLNTDETYWSEQMYKIFQIDPLEDPPAIKKLAKKILVDDYKKILSARKKAIEKGKDYSITLRFQRNDGSIRTIVCQTNIQSDHTGKVICMFGIVHDVTEIIFQDQVYSGANCDEKNLIESYEGLRRLTHEINNLLSVIVGRSSLMQMMIEKGNLTVGLVKNIEAIEKAAMKASKVVRLINIHLKKEKSFDKVGS